MEPRPDLQKPLAAFRGQLKRVAIHPLEKAVLCVVGIHLVFLPWAIGGMRAWGQWTSLGLAILGFCLALLPRNYAEEHSGGQRFRLIPWPRLVRFPIFWLGLALLGLITIQGFNPAWTYQTDGRGWWMQQIPHISWLPTGVEVPFARWGPWRMLIIYGSVWLTVCTMWIALTRRRSVQHLLLLLTLNGVALALFAIAQRLFSNGKIFWAWSPPVRTFFGSFVYKNHAGIYLDLVLALAVGFAGWYHLRGVRRFEKSNPAPVFVFLVLLLAIAIFISFARGATMVMFAFLGLSTLAFLIRQFTLPEGTRKPVVAIGLLVLFGSFTTIGLAAFQWKVPWDRLARGLAEEDASLESRRIATAASIEMLRDSFPQGTGAGSFQFLFPVWQQKYPEIFAQQRGRTQRRMFWEHAHNDIVQTPIELGLAGVLLLAVAAGYWVIRLIKVHFWENPMALAVISGLLIVLGSAWWDFPFQNPAILMTWWVLACGAVMWATFEERGG